MTKINKLCIKVLEYVKEHNMEIPEEVFQKICGEQTDAVLAELKNQRIGTYVSGFKSIWSINRDSLEMALSHYKSISEEKNSSLWKWVICIVISIIGIMIGVLL